MANQMVNQGFNRASNKDIRKALLEASSLRTWNLDIQSVLNNQEHIIQNLRTMQVWAVDWVLLSRTFSYDRFSKDTMVRARLKLLFQFPSELKVLTSQSRMFGNH